MLIGRRQARMHARRPRHLCRRWAHRWRNPPPGRSETPRGPSPISTSSKPTRNGENCSRSTPPCGVCSRESSRDHRSSAHSGRSDTLANALRASTSLLIASSKGSPSGGGEPRRRRRLTYSSFTSWCGLDWFGVCRPSYALRASFRRQLDYRAQPERPRRAVRMLSMLQWTVCSDASTRPISLP